MSPTIHPTVNLRINPNMNAAMNVRMALPPYPQHCSPDDSPHNLPHPPIPPLHLILPLNLPQDPFLIINDGALFVSTSVPFRGQETNFKKIQN